MQRKINSKRQFSNKLHLVRFPWSFLISTSELASCLEFLYCFPRCGSTGGNREEARFARELYRCVNVYRFHQFRSRTGFAKTKTEETFDTKRFSPSNGLGSQVHGVSRVQSIASPRHLHADWGDWNEDGADSVSGT